MALEREISASTAQTVALREPDQSIENFRVSEIQECRREVLAMISEAKPFTLQEYLAYALMQGIDGVEDGNIGVGAIAVQRESAKEYLFLGHNKVKTNQDSSAHAEMDVLDLVEKSYRGENLFGHERRRIIERSAPTTSPDLHTFIVTTCEPCPMCHVRMDQYNLHSTFAPLVEKVFIGSPDPEGATMLDTSEGKYPPRWTRRFNRAKQNGILVPVTPIYDHGQFGSFEYINSQYRELPLRILSIPKIATKSRIAPSANMS